MASDMAKDHSDKERKPTAYCLHSIRYSFRLYLKIIFAEKGEIAWKKREKKNETEKKRYEKNKTSILNETKWIFV